MAGHRSGERKGGTLGDALLIVAALFASIPLFYVYELLLGEAVAGVLMIATPVAMAIGTMISLRPSRTAGQTVDAVGGSGLLGRRP